MLINVQLIIIIVMWLSVAAFRIKGAEGRTFNIGREILRTLLRFFL